MSELAGGNKEGKAQAQPKENIKPVPEATATHADSTEPPRDPTIESEIKDLILQQYPKFDFDEEDSYYDILVELGRKYYEDKALWPTARNMCELALRLGVSGKFEPRRMLAEILMAEEEGDAALEKVKAIYEQGVQEGEPGSMSALGQLYQEGKIGAIEGKSGVKRPDFAKAKKLYADAFSLTSSSTSGMHYFQKLEQLKKIEAEHDKRREGADEE